MNIPTLAPRQGRSSRPFDMLLPPKTFAGFLAAMLALFMIAALSYLSLESRAAGARAMAQSLSTTQHLAAVLSLLKDAETGQRGFLLSGTDTYLNPYNGAVATLPVELAAVRKGFEENPDEAEHVATLERLTNKKMAELARTIELQRVGNQGAALELVRSDRGRELMDQIRSLTSDMEQSQKVVLDARTRAWEESVQQSALVTWGGSGLLLFLVIAAAMMSSKDFRTQRIQEWLQTGQAELSALLQGEQNVRE